MSTQEELLARLKRKNARLRNGGEEVFEEGVQEEVFQERTEQSLQAEIFEESIAMLRMRPVLPVKDDRLALEFSDDDERKSWLPRLEATAGVANAAIPSVGRIELTGSRFAWIGTGWLIDENILVTNRHVALEFTQRDGQRFAFQPGIDIPEMRGRVDFAQEIGATKRPVLFELVKPLWVEDKPGPDVAFFEIARTADNGTGLATPLQLADKPAPTDDAATIGYPAYDSRIPQPAEMKRIFADIYDKKRFAPGGVIRVLANRLEHDCTTLGGNSGSVVLDLKTGKVLGLHFSGTYLDRNYAVPSNVVRELLDRVKSGKVWVAANERRAVDHQVRIDTRDGASTTVTIPLTVTVSLGGAARPARPVVRVATGAPQPDVVVAEEGRVEDYADRTGYDANFLADAAGRPVRIEFPRVVRDEADILTFDAGGKRESALHYTHYSVVMSKARRMCFLSAVNIDGNVAKKAKRVAWKWDPRIPKSQQIMAECYGATPKFSRGHMTRREDPGWGSASEAKRGNEDSMHVTNTCPQMQAFNSPIWLALEDYALQHAKEDKMRISVFTGPYFDERDPTRFDVRIPVAFWKVIAFIHDDTGKLCATGYEMDQQQSIPSDEEFVFGQFVSPQLSLATQVPIRAIEFRSGIDFGPLAAADALAGVEESLGQGERAPLGSLDEIRFV
jgi:endonuclease G, mitochondrial